MMAHPRTQVNEQAGNTPIPIPYFRLEKKPCPINNIYIIIYGNANEIEAIY